MWFSYLKYLQASWDLIFLERSRLESTGLQSLEDPESQTKSHSRKCLVKSDKSLVVEIANQLDSWNNASFKVCNILGEINRHTTLNALKMQQNVSFKHFSFLFISLFGFYENNSNLSISSLYHDNYGIVVKTRVNFNHKKLTTRPHFQIWILRSPRRFKCRESKTQIKLFTESLNIQFHI